MNREERIELEKKLIDGKNNYGLVCSSLKLQNLKPVSGHISESISLSDWAITIGIDPDWKPENDRNIAEYMKSKGENDNPIYVVARDLLKHAAGHWEYPYRSGRGCPFDIEHHEIILDATAKALIELGKLDIATENKKGYVDEKVRYLANVFEDMCVNANIAYTDGAYPGAAIFFYDQASQNREIPPFYEAFIKLNMKLFGTEEEKKLLEGFYKNPKEVEDVVNSVISELGLVNKLEKNVKLLFKKELWHDMAYRFAYNMGKLLEDRPIPTLFCGGSNPFDEIIENPMELGRLIVGRHRAGMDAPSYLKPFDALDLFYQRLAAEIPLLAETSRERMKFPVVRFGYEPFDEDKHDPKDINLRKLKVGEKGEIIFQVSRHHLDIDVPLKKASHGFPDIAYLLDTSESMLDPKEGNQIFDAPWTDKCKYHFALLGLYGSLKYLQTRNISPHIRYNLFNFSGSTLSLGRPVVAKELAKLRKLALSPQFDGTWLDVGKLKSELYEEPSVIIMLSDGEIWNWNDIKEDFRMLVGPHLFSFIRIGVENETSEDIERWGKPVYKVEKEEDITRLVIDLTKQAYKPWIKY